LWTTTVVRHCIATRLGIEDCRERVRQLRHAPGFRLRRRRHRHLQAKPEAHVALRTELEALLEAWPEAWELLCVEEATVRRHPTLTAQCCLVDEGPEVPTGDDHTKVHVYGAVAPLTGRTRSQISPAWGQGDFAPFWPHLWAYHPGTQL
jgi:hypothetical protein